MLITNIILDDIIASSRPEVRSVIYELGRPTWVSSHVEAGRPTIGPLAIVDAEAEDASDIPVSVTAFPPRALSVRSESELDVISFRDVWTIPAKFHGGTIYTLLLPPDHIALDTRLDSRSNHPTWEPAPLRLSAGPDGRLFFHTVFSPIGGIPSDGLQHEFNVEARIVADREQCSELVSSAEVVKNTETLSHSASEFRHRLGTEAGDPTFWIKLVGLLAKIIT